MGLAGAGGLIVQRVVVYAARGPVYRKLAGALVVLGAGAALLQARILPAAGWALVGIGALYGMLLLRALGEDRERVVIDDAGIRDTTLPVGTIGWDEVRNASVQEIGRIRVVVLEVRDPERFIRQLPRGRGLLARKALEVGLPGLYLSLAGTDADAKQIAETIWSRIRPGSSADR